MEERNLRAKRYLQAESIINNLKHKSTRTATGGSKKIRKIKKRNLTHKSSVDSTQSSNILVYRDSRGELKKVEFVVGVALSVSPEEIKEPVDDHVNISEMFLRTYKQLMQTNIIKDDFYNNVAYDKEKESVFLFNKDKNDYFEIYNGESKASQARENGQDLMKPVEFKTLVKEYQLNNLYC